MKLQLHYKYLCNKCCLRQRRPRSQSEVEFTAEAVTAAVAAEKARSAEAVAAAVAMAQTAAAETAAAIATTTAAAIAAALTAAAATREQNWKCSICFDVFNNPTSLSCGHTFCHKCIKTALEMKEECPNCRAKIPRTLPLAVNIATQEFIAENAGPMFVKRKAEMTEAFYKALVDLDPKAAFDALSRDVDLRRFVGDAALKTTPLLWACKNAKGVARITWNYLIAALLKAGADVNTRDSEGKSALVLAATTNLLFTWISTIPALLDHGARDPSALSWLASQPLINLIGKNLGCTVCNGIDEIKFYTSYPRNHARSLPIDSIILRMAEDESYSLLNPTQKLEDLANMLKNGYDRSALALFDQHVRLEVTQKMLYWAAAGGCALFIHKLLDAGNVAVNVVFENRQTALHIACHMGQAQAALALLDCGASNFECDDFKRYPLDYAKKNKMVDVVIALEVKGCT